MNKDTILKSKLKGFNINIDDVKPNDDIYEIAKYIKKVYSLNPLINLSWNNLEQICFINKKLSHPYCSFYFDICPKWGYAPGKLLIHHSQEKKDHTGSSGSLIYEGIESIDWLMQNTFGMVKVNEQLELF